MRSRIEGSSRSGCRAWASTFAWLNPLARRRTADRGIGTTISAWSSAGSTQGIVRIKWANDAAQPGWLLNLKRLTRSDHGYSYETAATQASSTGGWVKQAPQRGWSVSMAKAQVLQRGCGWANSVTQASQTGLPGQVWHTAHWLGMASKARLTSLRNIKSIYSPR